MAKFEAGKEYSFNWYCEDGGTSRLTIVSRTEKTVVISYKGEQKRKKIYVDSNGEYIMPTGVTQWLRYAMPKIYSKQKTHRKKIQQ